MKCIHTKLFIFFIFVGEKPICLNNQNRLTSKDKLNVKIVKVTQLDYDVIIKSLDYFT